jgi:ABC-type uncharacterized transport system ATPase component
MKKVLLILVAVIGFGISVNAGVIFRSQQSVCSGNEQIILKSSGVVQIFANSTLQYSGRYTIEDNVIILSIEGGEFRAKATMNSSKTKLHSLTFNDVTYRSCD